MARYLLAATPLPGHVLPMVEIGADLVARGHEVLLLTGLEYSSTAQRRGLAFAPLTDTARPQQPRGSKSPVGLIGQLRRGRAEIRTVYIDPLGAQCNDLRAALNSWGGQVDAVLVDVAFTGALALLLRSEARPPVVVCGVSPLAVSSRDTAPFGMGRQPQVGVDHTRMNQVVHRVMFGDVQTRFDTALRAAGARKSPVFLTDWPTLADRLLQLTVAEFDYPRSDLPSSVVFAGTLPSHAVDDRVMPVAVQERIANARVVVHVTQGTWDNGDLTQLVAPTLAALADRDDVYVVASTGGVPLPPEIVVPDNAFVGDYLPYPWLLPRIDLMVTNGGYGGVQYALGNGVPLVVAGRTADKPEVAARVAYTGVGIDLATDHPSTNDVRDAVDRILGDPGYASAASRMAALMAAADPFATIADVLAQLAAGEPERTNRL